MSNLIDIGVNLTHKSLLCNIDTVMERARVAGVGQMVVTGTDLAESEKAIELCARFPTRLVSTCGVHPHHASEWTQDSYPSLLKLAKAPCVRAIGETGLDFNRNYSAREEQELAFGNQMALAAATEKPLFCHQRDAHLRFIEMLTGYRQRLGRVVIHCFTDSRAALKDYLDLDCYIGITGWICDERRGLDLQQMVKFIPDERLLLETDAPYLLPRTLPDPPRGRVNEPALLGHILQQVAAHRNQPIDQLARQTLRNSRRFFDLYQYPH